VFKGNARDYFRLWIVNLCLTLLTFGIFSAWAKVRRKRYFYSHTELSGVPFEYLGAPLPILKGRIVGTVLLALWYVGTHFSLRLLVVALGLFSVLAPWVMVRTAAFNARYSSYRNITFEFNGTYFGVARALFVGLLLSVLTFGMGYCWAYTNVRRYFVEHTSYGGVPGRYTARGGHLLGPFWVALMSIFGISGAIGWQVHRGHGAGLTPLLVASYVVYGLCYAYWEARVGQVNWRHTTLGPLRFRANYRPRDFVKLYFTNALGVLGSFALLVPWAAIRMYRYRVERLTVIEDGELSRFVGQPGHPVRATGAEVMDLFDFEVSL
jgi:uncharacterized membrane protein YjgN (DUF898 family)